MRYLRRGSLGVLWDGCRVKMIFARRRLLFSDVHKVSTTLPPGIGVITEIASSELIGDIVAGRIVFHH